MTNPYASVTSRPDPSQGGAVVFNESPPNLEQRVMQQLQKEFEHFNGCLPQLNGVMRVVTNKSLREGDAMGLWSGLTFDSLEKLSSSCHSGESNTDFITTRVLMASTCATPIRPKGGPSTMPLQVSAVLSSPTTPPQ